MSADERLAVVETKVTGLDGKVDRLEGKVDILSQAYFEDRGRNKGRSDMGVWVRAALPWVIGIGSAFITVFGIVTR